MPASVAGRGDAEQQSTVSPPDPLQFRLFFRRIVAAGGGHAGPIQGDPLEVGFSEPDCFSPFADDEERPRNEDRSDLSCLGDLNGRGD